MKDFRSRFADKVYQRGVKYQKDGKVNGIGWGKDGHFIASVQSSDRFYYYRVTGVYKNGKASELKCNCPWAQAGHNCKHMAAVLLEIKQNEDAKNGNGEKPRSSRIAFVDAVPDDLKAKIADAHLTVNPLQLITGRTFTNSDYNKASTLGKEYTLVNEELTKTNDNRYLYTTEFRSRYGYFMVYINFNLEKITDITAESRINKNINQDVFFIMGLLHFVLYFLKHDPFDQTNDAAKRLLTYFQSRNKPGQAITFRAQIENDQGTVVLYFKIGEDQHLYKVQNLQNMVNSAREGEVVKFGKYFDDVVDPDRMDQDSLTWYQFAQKLVDIQSATRIDDFNELKLKNIPLKGTLADQVDEMISSGLPIYENKTRIRYDTEKLDLPIDIKLNKNGDSAIVNVFPFQTYERIFAGNKNYYSCELNRWTKYTGLTPDSLDQVGIFPGQKLQFSSKTLKTFGHRILPHLSKNKNLKITGAKKLDKVLPPRAEFVFQLDYHNEEITCQALVNYGKQKFILGKTTPNDSIRDFEEEKNAMDLLQTYFDQNNDHYFLSMKKDKKVHQFLNAGITKLKGLGRIEVTAAFKQMMNSAQTSLNVHLEIHLRNNTLDLTVTGPSMSAEDISALLDAYQQQKHYFILRNGEIRKLDSPSIEELDKVMTSLNLNLKDFTKGKLTIPAYRAFYLQKLLEQRDNLKFSSDHAFKNLVDDLEKGKIKEAKVPAKLDKVLRPYQKDGFKWLATMVHYNLGGLLADEMGLGKTLQVLTLLVSLKGKGKSNLIVAPASVIYNWQNEIEKFTPELSCVVLGGTKKQRQEQLQTAENKDVLITSYDSLKRDLEFYQDKNFETEIIDEAQNIKNAKSAAAKAVKIIDAEHKFALTGTPIENNLSELWSIFDYLMPGFLGNYTYFKQTFEQPIVKDHDKNKEEQLSQLIAPFVLRRLKKNVLKDLPAKDEKIVYVQLAGKQKELYQAQTQRLLMQLGSQNDKDFKKHRFQILAELTKLRELCCDPRLLYKNYQGKSAKLAAALDLVRASLDGGHKILLFSQFTSMLAIIRQRLVKDKVTIFEIIGSTPKLERQKLIEKFNKLKHPAVFLISLKAGGTGINLTSADVVIHYDPWWNIAAESQATDRAHRIGQKNSVQIYKIVAKNTIEDKIIELQKRKAKLAEAVLSGKTVGSTKLNRDDILEILDQLKSE